MLEIYARLWYNILYIIINIIIYIDLRFFMIQTNDFYKISEKEGCKIYGRSADDMEFGA